MDKRVREWGSGDVRVRVKGLAFRVWSFGFRIQGQKFRVKGLVVGLGRIRE